MQGAVSAVNPTSKLFERSRRSGIEYSEAHWQPHDLPEDLEIIREKRYGSTPLVFLGGSLIRFDKYL